MNLSANRDFELFYKNPLFNGLDREQVRDLFSLSKEAALKEGDYLMKEGDPSKEIFFILEGSLEVRKNDPEFQREYLIDTFGPGDTVGELVLLEQTQRSASVRALTPARLRVFAAERFAEFLKTHREFNSIYYQFFRKLTQRLHNTTGVALKAMQAELREYKTRAELGVFLVLLTTGICLFTFALEELKYLLTVVPSSFFITLPLTAFFLLFLYLLVHFSSLSLSDVGITTKNWRRAVADGLVFLLPFMAISLLGKMWAIHSVPLYAHSPLFDPYNVMFNPADRTIPMWFTLMTLYMVISAPLQELIVRGVLQGLLEKLLLTKHNVLMSILISNLIFATFHLFFSVPVGIFAFFGGLGLGKIYARSHNLLGNWLAHALGGAWTFCILGILPTQ